MCGGPLLGSFHQDKKPRSCITSNFRHSEFLSAKGHRVCAQPSKPDSCDHQFLTSICRELPRLGNHWGGTARLAGLAFSFLTGPLSSVLHKNIVDKSVDKLRLICKKRQKPLFLLLLTQSGGNTRYLQAVHYFALARRSKHPTPGR